MLSHDAMMKFFDKKHKECPPPGDDSGQVSTCGPGISSGGQKTSFGKTKVKSEFKEKNKKERNLGRNQDGQKPKTKFVTPKCAPTKGSDVLKDLHFFKSKHSNSSTMSKNSPPPTTPESTETVVRVKQTSVNGPTRSKPIRDVSEAESPKNLSNNKPPFTVRKVGSCFVMDREKPAKPPSKTKPALNKAISKIKTPTVSSLGPTISTHGTQPTSLSSLCASRSPLGASRSPPSQSTSEPSPTMPKDVPPHKSTSDLCPTLSKQQNAEVSCPEIFAVKTVVTPVNDTTTETSLGDKSQDDEVDSSSYKCGKCGKSFSYLARFISH